MDRYLPGILDAFEKSVKHQYLLLSSLKEVIVCHANTPGLEFGPYVDQVRNTPGRTAGGRLGVLHRTWGRRRYM